MKIKKLLCVALACLLLAGCGSRKTAGNMEDAVAALVWQDYDTAFAEADAFLQRMPDNQDAQNVHQTAAWGKLKADVETVKLSKGTWVKLDQGFTVQDLPVKGKSDIQITGYWVGMDHDRQTISGYDVEVYFLRSVTFYWTDATGAEYSCEIYTPANLTKKNLDKSLAEQSLSTVSLDEQTRQLVFRQAGKVLADSLQDVFKQIEKQTDLTPADLGFTAWNG